MRVTRLLAVAGEDRRGQRFGFRVWSCALVFGLVGGCSDVGEGNLAARSDEIVNGRPLALNDVDMVHVVRDVTNDERARCSAVMLTTSAVLTAGHCGFEPASPATLTVRSGTPGSTVDSVTARKSIVHPTYIGAEDGTDKLAVRELGIDLAVILPDVPFFNLPAQPLGVSAPPASTLLQTPARIVGRMLSGTSGTDDFGVYFMDAPILEIQTVVRAGKNTGVVGHNLGTRSRPREVTGLSSTS